MLEYNKHGTCMLKIYVWVKQMKDVLWVHRINKVSKG